MINTPSAVKQKVTNSFAYSESSEKNQFHPAHYKKHRVKEIQFFQGQHFVTQQQNQTYDAYIFFPFKVCYKQ